MVVVGRPRRYAAHPLLASRSLLPIEVALVALAAVVATWVIAAPGTVPGWEERVFGGINGLPGWLFPPVWGPMQLGSVVGAVFVAATLFGFGRRIAATTYAAAGLAGWLVARTVKEVVARERPLGVGLETVIRGVDSSGFGFISGHTTVAFAGATVIWVFFGRRWGSLAYVVAAVVGFARIYVGAHLPLDVIGGAAAGTLVAGIVTRIEVHVLRRRQAGIPSES